MEKERAKKILKTVVTVIIVVAVVLAALKVTSNIFQPKNNQKEFGMIDSTANAVVAEPQNSIDVVFMGDSETYTSYSPMLLWNEYGFTSYDCATSGQILPYTYTLLHRMFSVQSPKVVVIDTHMVYTTFYASDAIFRVAADIFPVFEYHDRWKSLTLNDFTSAAQTTWTDELKGFLGVVTTTKAADSSNYMAATDDVNSIPELNKIYLDMIIDYCESEGATPILVSTPSTKNWDMSKHNGIAAYAEEKGLDYIDLSYGSDNVDIDWQTESMDGGDHVNYFGTVKITKYIGQVLDEKFDLPDHRGDTAYSSWDQDYARYLEKVKEQGL